MNTGLGGCCSQRCTVLNEQLVDQLVQVLARLSDDALVAHNTHSIDNTGVLSLTGADVHSLDTYNQYVNMATTAI